ncbi:MFS transporter [bacterium]|nr:MFS transporter [bacterium]
MFSSNLRYLWLGQFISLLGDSVSHTALLFLVLELTGSNSQTGFFSMFMAAPQLLFGLYSGVIADRFNRQKLMISADLVRAFLIVLVPVSSFFGFLNVWLLSGIAFLVVTFTTVFDPSRDALVPLLVEDKKELLKANSFVQSSGQFARFSGQLVASSLIRLIGLVNLFFIDALSYIFSAVFLSKIKLKNEEKTRTNVTFEKKSEQFKEGFRLVKNNPVLWKILFLTVLNNIFIMGPAIVGLPIFVKDVLKQGAEDYALIQFCFFGGMILSNLLILAFAKKVPKGKFWLIGLFLDGITYIPLIWITSFWGTCFVIFLHAAAVPILVVPRTAILQEQIENKLLGRVFSFFNVAVNGVTAVSMGLTGFFADFLSINIIFGVIGVGGALCGISGYFFKDLREIK